MKTKLLLFLLALVPAAALAKPWVYTPFGLSTDTTISISDINDRGDVVGALTYADSRRIGFCYTRTGEVRFIYSPDPLDLYSTVNPSAIDPTGRYVVGGFVKSGPDIPVRDSAFVFDLQTRVFTDLGGVGPAPLLGSSAYDVTMHPTLGLLIVGFEHTDANDPSSKRAVEWVGPAHLRESYGFGSVQARAVNRFGSVAGSAGAQGEEFPFLRHRGGATTEYPRLAEDYGSHANDVNDQGDIVGYGNINGAFLSRAFLIPSGSTKLIDLGDLDPQAETASIAEAINVHRQIVGTSITSHETRAFLYENGVMKDLNSFLPPGTGATLVTATDINRYGQVVGTATKGGSYFGFLLSPPPSFAIAGKKTIFVPELKRNVTIAGTGTLTLSSVVYRVGNRGKFRTAKGTSRWRFTAKIPPGASVITVIGKGPGGSTTPSKIRIRRR